MLTDVACVITSDVQEEHCDNINPQLRCYPPVLELTLINHPPSNLIPTCSVFPYNALEKCCTGSHYFTVYFILYTVSKYSTSHKDFSGLFGND